MERDLGPVLDDRAKAAYRERIVELNARYDEARAQDEVGRAERAERELEALTRELARATGLGGRRRTRGASSERARSAVTRALRRAIEALRAAEPELATHLDASVRTGSACAYVPDDAVPMRWRVSP